MKPTFFKRYEEPNPTRTTRRSPVRDDPAPALRESSVESSDGEDADRLSGNPPVKPFYFNRFEDRKPPEPVPHSPARELLWQFLAVINLCLGLWYVVWRWTDSLNFEALWFAIPLAIAETCALFGLFLFTINLWKVRDYAQTPPPTAAECIHTPEPFRPDHITADVFFPTYDEDPELVRYSIRDAKAITYPHPLDLRIHVLDDGNRSAMAAVAEEEGVGYLTRDSNIGFKAGNLQNAMRRTSGEFILICDADTRPFPTILAHTLGYFRDPDVAWVQTPQWFYDLPEGRPLDRALGRKLGAPGRWLGRTIQRAIGPFSVGRDPFNNDPQMFYDVIQRRRNWANASFCCGAGSVHRREAVQLMALRNRGLELEGLSEKYDEAEAELLRAFDRIEGKFLDLSKGLTDRQYRAHFAEAMRDAWSRSRKEVRQTLRENASEVNFFFLENPVPYKHHVSEDMYTSLLLHAERVDPDANRRWKSVFHPGIESRMLSTQDLLSWTIQRFKYAGGAIDIAWREKHLLFSRALSLPQKLMYGATFWSYLGCLWNTIFLIAPIVYLFTGIPPVEVYSVDFFKHFFPFIIANTLAMMVGTWGVPAWQGQSTYLSFFAVNLKALWKVMRREQRRFPRLSQDLRGELTVNGRTVPAKMRDMSKFGRYVLFARSGLRVEPEVEIPDLRVGDPGEVKFTMNDKARTMIREKVVVRRIDGRSLGVETQRPDGEKISFTVTPKLRQERNFAKLVTPQLAIIALTVCGLAYALTLFHLGHRHDTVALLANAFWGGFNILALGGVVRAAFWKPSESGETADAG
ncbi:MAG: glycosyltransferase [Desulfococcaceae bacterium]